MRSIRFNLTQVLSILTLYPLLLVMSCSKSSNNNNPSGPDNGFSTQTINPAQGGTVTYGSASVTIPPGALTDTVNVTVAAAPNAPNYTVLPGAAQVGQIYEITPSGQPFTAPVTITLSYIDQQLGAYDENTLIIFTYSDTGATPAALANPTRDPANNTITGTTTHFSYFMIGAVTAGDNYPQPSGGNPVGDWSLSRIDYQLITTLPDTVQVTVTGSGIGALHLGTTDFEEWFGTVTQFQSRYKVFGIWGPPLIITYFDTTHTRGIYTILGDTLISTIQWSDTDPGDVGDIQHIPFTAASNRLILYYPYVSPTEPPYAFNSWSVLYRQ